MNIIVLLFIIVSVVFVSSSANNLIAVTTSLDTYFDKAGVSDCIIIEKNKGNGKHSDEIAKELDSVKEVKTEHTIYISDIFSKNKSEANTEAFNISLLVSVDKLSTKIFDADNKEITSIPKGYMYVEKSFLSEKNVKIGDTVTATVDNVKKDFIIKGTTMDATFGGAMMGTPRYFVNDEDFNYFYNSDIKDGNKGRLIYINTEDTDAVSKAISNCPHIAFQGTKDMIKTTYMMDILLAEIMLIVSAFLIIIALVILRFTITFTLTEEYKQIGIMKAIGIRNLKIRSLYMVKYFAISVVGAIVGFALSIPFGNMMLKETSESIMLTSSGGFIYSILATILLVGIVMLFCFRCTRKVKKFTPVDAIRNGSNGERFKRKSLIRLHKSHLNPVFYMSINDIFSNIKRFSIMLVTFTIGILLITIVTNTAATLSIPSLTTLFGQNECNVYLHEKNNSDAMNYFAEDGKTKKLNEFDRIKNIFSKNGIETDIFEEIVFMFNVENKKGDSYSTRCYQGINTKATDYVYLEGTAPVNENEIAVTRQTAEKFSVGIGDTLIIDSVESKEKISDYRIFSNYE